MTAENWFRPESMTLARHRRGLNKTKLAKAIGVTPQTVTSYEREDTIPSMEVIARMAEALSFPIDFFLHEVVDPVAEDSVSFRKLSKMTASQRDISIASGTFGVALLRWIEERFDLPEADLPDLQPGIIDPESAAAYVRTSWRLGPEPIKSMLHLVEKHGVRVFALPDECREVDAFSFWREGTPFICVSTQKTAERTVFDLAHELGHLVLHRDHAEPRGRAEEHEADAFASCLLMPADDVRRNLPKFPGIGDLVQAKRRWRVSTAAMAYRGHKLELITDWHYRELCIELSRYGRNRELSPDTHDHSLILNQTLSALREEGVTRRDIARDLRMLPRDLDALLRGLTVEVVDGEGQSESGGDPQSDRPHLRLV